MLGKKRERRTKLFYYGIELDERVGPEHPLRQVLELVDFSFVRERVANCYGRNGHPSEDPIVLMKLMFLLFFDNVKSERALLRMVPLRLDYLWFLGLDLDDEVPHHSVLSKARRRWGREVFEELFVAVVRQCVQLGLVRGDKVHVDGSLVAADASQQSVMRGGAELVEQLKGLYAEQESKLEGVAASEKRPDYYQKQNRGLVSRTDPEAAVVKQNKASSSRPRYKHHRVVDDQCGVVTAMETTPGDVEENRELVGLVRQHEKHTGERVQTVVADCQYGTQDNLAWCGKTGIESHLGEFPPPRVKGIFPSEAFRWDEDNDCYWCPAGQALTRQPRRKKPRVHLYRASARICRACEFYGQCTRSQTRVRKIRRHILQNEIDRARAQSHSAAARRSRRRRQVLIEGSFADAANNHHFKRARWRGLTKQKIQDALIGVCQNLRIILRQSGCRPVFSPAQKGRTAPLAADFSLIRAFFGPLFGLLRPPLAPQPVT